MRIVIKENFTAFFKSYWDGGDGIYDEPSSGSDLIDWYRNDDRTKPEWVKKYYNISNEAENAIESGDSEEMSREPDDDTDYDNSPFYYDGT